MNLYLKSNLKIMIGICAVFASQLVLAKTVSKEIEAVENGLRSSVQFAGDSSWTIDERMKHYGVPGVSIAVIKDYKIHWAKNYGVTDKETGQLVDENTLFQAGSISKPVAAYGALKLVEQKKLSLDLPVNQYLSGWKIPENDLTKQQPVALKHLLNHSAGLTVHGFPGYANGEAVPTELQILDGLKPANTSPIRVDLLPETEFRYSGGGYTVIQKLISDVTKTDFPEIMNTLVLSPLKMTQSTYEQPLPPEKLKFAAAGYLPNKLPVPGKRHTYPEMAAAGLWTTATDLAKFAIDVQLAIQSNKSAVLSQAMTNKMLTPFVSELAGLGFFVQKINGESYFGHGGWDEGFSADLIGHKTGGFGVVIMTNSNHPAFIEELKNSVAATYQWENYLQPNLVAMPVTKAERQRIIGRYSYSPDMIFTIYDENEKIFMKYLNDEPMEVFRVGENQYVRREINAKFRFEQLPNNDSVSLIFGVDGELENIRTRLKDNEKIPFEYVVSDEFDKAEKKYQELIAQYPDSKEEAEWNVLSRADLLVAEDKKESALKLFQMSSRLFSTVRSFIKLADFYQNNGDVKNAIVNFEKAKAIEPDNQLVLNALKRLGV